MDQFTSKWVLPGTQITCLRQQYLKMITCLFFTIEVSTTSCSQLRYLIISSTNSYKFKRESTLYAPIQYKLIEFMDSPLSEYVIALLLFYRAISSETVGLILPMLSIMKLPWNRLSRYLQFWRSQILTSVLFWNSIFRHVGKTIRVGITAFFK